MLRALQLARHLRPLNAATVRLLSSSPSAGGYEPPNKLVEVSIDSQTRVATITLNNPSKLNAMDVAMGEDFKNVVDYLSSGEGESANVGAVVLTGKGKAFSAGGDLEWLKERTTDTPSRNAVVMRKFYERFLSLRSLPFPVIAAINGPAIGAGLCVALACDVRVVNAKARCGLTFVGLGLHPGMAATHFLPLLVGHQQANRLLLTGEVITGQEAEKIGMVLKACENPEETVLEANKLAGQMAQQSPIAVRACLRTLRNASDEGLERALWREADAQTQGYASADLLRGVEAVIAKKRPEFEQYENYREL